jgi:hypothetical protein
VSAFDVLTIAVLAFIGVRIAGGTRIALSGNGRRHVVGIMRGLRPRHFVLAVPVLTAVVVAVVLLVQIPGLDFGWWTALGGIGNPVTGTTDRTAGTALEWLIPLVFLVMLIPALPLFAETEEQIFRFGSEKRTGLQRMGKGVQFGLAHAIIGIPIGAALGLSIGGWYFTWWYMRAYKRTHDPGAAMLESTRAHLAYNMTVVVIVLAAVLLAGGS